MVFIVLGKSSDDEESVEPTDLGQCPTPCPVLSAVPGMQTCLWLMISSLVLLLAY